VIAVTMVMMTMMTLRPHNFSDLQNSVRQRGFL